MPPPSGYTGHKGAVADRAQLDDWAADRASGNIAVRLPEGVIAFDVDNHDGKRGSESLLALEAEAEAGVQLPPTWWSTSREDGSRQLFFRVPRGQSWPGDLGSGSGVEILQRVHRYAVVWPSINPHNEKRLYRWHTPEGQAASRVPRVDELARLPKALVSALTADVRPASVKADDVQAAAFLKEIKSHAGAAMDEVMRKKLAEAVSYLSADGHGALNRYQPELIRLAEFGHPGLSVARAAFRERFVAEVGLRRDDSAALGAEFDRGWTGAVQIVAADRAPANVRRAFAPGGWLHPDSRRFPGERETLRPPGEDDMQEATESRYRYLVADKAARDRLAREEWSPPADEGDLNYQIAHPEPAIGNLVEGLIPARGVVQINAQYKAGKTTLASVNLPKALVTGEPFLQHFKVEFEPKECVGIWNLEVDRQDLVHWLEQVDIPEDARSRIFPKSLRGNRSVDFRNPLAVEWTVNWLRDNKIGVWIVDPLSKLYRGDENSSTEFNQWWQALEDIMGRAGVRVTVLVHHSGHSAEGRARGTSAMMGNPDVLVEYRHSGNHGDLPTDRKRYLRAFGRRIEQPEITLDFNPATGELFVDAAGRSRAEDRRRQWGMKACQALTSAGRPLNQGELLKAMHVQAKGKNNEPAKTGIAYAEEKGWIQIAIEGPAKLHTLGPISPYTATTALRIGATRHENDA
ncbi:hypothetical protein BKG68_15900 [Mycobacteroides saopaulense]|uniref:DNA primase/polymerase bifunctional N-terminal domain-containing protein n=2 Tax=Mycobacteroides saopaulense TaxID=1578165 RepID=A0ABX3C378_9MYCO|nr:hypothetical protein BKG68_15900 [Mycobacteroides saopaulense]OHU11431.1 hypothetical protein BKG73_08940 [Mycobacteroides saopaulense]